MGLLYLLIFFAIACATLWLLWKFWGKTGVFVFGTLTILFSLIYSSSLSYTLQNIDFSITMFSYIPFIAGAILLIEKFGKKEALAYMLTSIIVCVAFMFFRELIGAVMGGESLFAFSSFWQILIANLIAIAADIALAIWLKKLFDGKITNFLLRVFVIFAIVIVVDAIIFVGIMSIGSEIALGDTLVSMLNNIWQKLILAALATGLLFFCFKTNTKQE